LNELRPPNNIHRTYNTIPDVIYDLPIPNRPDGTVITDANETYNIGETVITEFVGANPRNQQSDPFMVIEWYNSKLEKWSKFDDDSSWDTKVHWKK